MSREPASVFDLSPAEKPQLVEDLWDDLASTPENVPIHDWQKEEVERRKANLKNAPGSGLSWEEVCKRIRHRHGRQDALKASGGTPASRAGCPPSDAPGGSAG
jgi:putative addiction module component (TIGR02574 family)